MTTEVTVTEEAAVCPWWLGELNACRRFSRLSCAPFGLPTIAYLSRHSKAMEEQPGQDALLQERGLPGHWVRDVPRGNHGACRLSATDRPSAWVAFVAIDVSYSDLDSMLLPGCHMLRALPRTLG